jgi:hypothetical protein
MEVTAAGITGGEPREMTVAERTIAEHVYGIAPTTMDVKTGSSGDAWSAYVAFDWATLYIVLECWDNNLDVELSLNGGFSYKDAQEIDVARPLLIPFTATGFRHRNTTPGSVARYQVSGLGTGF